MGLRRCAISRGFSGVLIFGLFQLSRILLIVTLYPSAFVVWMSLQKTRYHDLIGFAGLANYVEVLGSREFWDTTLISLIYVVGSLTGAIILGMVAALALNAAGTMGTLLQSS